MTIGETSALKNNQVLIKVRYAPVSNYDRSCLDFKREQIVGKETKEALGSEGSGIIE
jgi:NADPH:quinone reductase-like Zn-dependent oxidoreductase